MVRKALGFGKLAIGQPELRLAVSLPHVNMGRFALVQAEEQKLVASPSQDRRHPNCSDPAKVGSGALLVRRCPEAALDVVRNQRLELLGDPLAAERAGLLAVDEHRRGRALAGARQADPDVRMLALARAVDD